MHFYPFIVVPFFSYFIVTFTAATGTMGPPPGCTLNTEREYGFGYERLDRPLTSTTVPCNPRPSLPESAIAPRARITNGNLTIIKPVFKLDPNNDMDGLSEAEPNPSVRMAFTEDGRLVDVSRAVVYSASPIDNRNAVFSYCEPDGYVLFRGRKDFWGCTREAGKKNEEKLFISTYIRAGGACERYRMRMLPCEEDAGDDSDVGNAEE